MKHLDGRQIVRRLLFFGFLAFALTVAIVTVELSLGSGVASRPVTAWMVLTVGLGGWALWSVRRWQGTHAMDQAGWQPQLFLRALNGAFAFQAGVLAYFVSADLLAAITGAIAFFAVLVIVIRTLPALEFSDE
ncbi:MAG TPA: hypothetical protein ENH15_01370 [Actinobacteria bacterium]|nr:hypothetical protein [Actinomycetota bacterium]